MTDPRTSGADAPASTEAPAEVPTGVKLALMALSLVVGGVLSEGLIRVIDDGALPHLALFDQADDGRIVMAPDRSMDVRAPGGQIFEVATDALGLRAASAGAAIPSDGGWLVVGDSQVLGMGVQAEQAFAARPGFTNAGVPGHGVADAVAQARVMVPVLRPQGVVVVVNQANDWEEGTVLAGDRYSVHGGWLLRAEVAHSPWRAFWSSPLSRVHLLVYIALLATVGQTADFGASAGDAPPWLAAPGQQGPVSAALAAQIDALASELAPLPVIAAFLPVDVAASQARMEGSPFGRLAEACGARPWQDDTLRDQLLSSLKQAQGVDLGSALRDRPDAFLDRDYHLSPTGHQAVGDLLDVVVSQ